MKTIARIIVAAAALSPVVSPAQIISWNMDGYGTITGSSQFAGVASAANWNDTYLIDGNSGNPENNLIDNSGAPTTLSESFVANSQYGWAIQFSSPGVDGTGLYNRNLLNGYLNNGNGASVTLSLTGIPYSQYDIYVYLSSDTANRTGTVNVGSTTYDFSTMGPAELAGGVGNFVQTTDTTGANPLADYAVFTGLSGGAETITTTIPAYGGIAGFQIVATPEPGVCLLVAAGGFALISSARRGRKA